jgi:small subunit ribosomal protein S7
MRRKRVYKKYLEADQKYGSIAVSRFINYVMYDGKKAVAEAVVYDALELIKKSTKEDPLKVFEEAIANAAPAVEVTSRRVGGANYQVPSEVRPDRRFILAARWIIGAARGKKGKKMAERLAEELVLASKNDGSAIKKKQDTHRMAEANRAFAHFARRRN